MDVLSEVLKAVKLDGALFYNAEFSAPWCARSIDARTVTSYLSPNSQHVIMFHLLTEGCGYAHVEGDDRSLPLNAGDILIVPHGDSHILGNGPPVTPVDRAQVVERVLSQGLKVSRMGGGGEVTKFICGYMSCDPQLSRVFLGGLPSMLKVSIRDDASGQWLENSIRYSVDNADASRPGGEAVLAKLSEVLFVEALRRYIALLPQEQTGWLAGVRDPEVGKALALLHRKPAHPWTIAALANEVGISRSVLADVSGVISRRHPLPTSHAGGFSSARKCSHPLAIASRRSLLRWAMSRSRPLIAPSNVSSASRRPDSAASRNLLAGKPCANE